MDKEKLIRRTSRRKEILINIRITKDLSNWLKEENYSPTGIFMEAVKELGYGG